MVDRSSTDHVVPQYNSGTAADMCLYPEEPLMPFFVYDIAGSRLLVRFFVKPSNKTMVASTAAPLQMSTPRAYIKAFTVSIN